MYSWPSRTHFIAKPWLSPPHREGASKIFQMPLSLKSITQNEMGGTPVLGALTTASAARQQEAAALEAVAAAAAASDAADRKKRHIKATGGADSSDEVWCLFYPGSGLRSCEGDMLLTWMHIGNLIGNQCPLGE